MRYAVALQAEAQRNEFDPLMGYTISSDTRPQVRLSFVTLDEAVAYAERCGIP